MTALIAKWKVLTFHDKFYGYIGPFRSVSYLPRHYRANVGKKNQQSTDGRQTTSFNNSDPPPSIASRLCPKTRRPVMHYSALLSYQPFISSHMPHQSFGPCLYSPYFPIFPIYVLPARDFTGRNRDTVPRAGIKQKKKKILRVTKFGPEKHVSRRKN